MVMMTLEDLSNNPMIADYSRFSINTCIHIVFQGDSLELYDDELEADSRWNLLVMEMNQWW